MSAAVEAEVQSCQNNTELAVRIAGEDTRRLLLIDAQSCVVAAMNCLGTVVDEIFVTMDKLKRKPAKSHCYTYQDRTSWIM